MSLASADRPTLKGYSRPADWLALPALSNGDQKFVGLLAITNDGSNFIALSCTGAYTVDWGDGGATENVASGVKAVHQYTWASISSSTLTSRGYRQALVTVTMQAGQTMTAFSLQQLHTQSGLSVHNVPWLDVAINGSSLTSFEVSKATIVVPINDLEVVWLGENSITDFTSMFNTCRSLQSLPHFNTASGTNFTNLFSTCTTLRTVPLMNTAAGTNFTGMFNACNALQTVPLLNTGAGTNFTSMFQACTALQTVPLLNTASGTNFTSMFQSCAGLTLVPLLNTAAGTNFTNMFNGCSALLTVPLLNTGAGTNFTGMFSTCSSLQTIPQFNTAAGTNFTSMFQTCRSLVTIPLLNTAAGVTFSGMFNSCAALSFVPQLNTASGTAFTNMFANCVSLSVGRLAGTTRAISYSGCKMSATEIDDMFTGLGTASGAQTVTVTGNWGTGGKTSSIATNKGWTVA